MKAIRFLLLLITIATFFITCSKNENEEFNPDLTKNAIFIGNSEFLLAQGFVACVWQKHPYDFLILLYSSGFSYDTSKVFYEALGGIGDIISMEITADTWDGPNPGTYSTDVEDGEPGFMLTELIININLVTFEASHWYELTSGTMMLLKEGNAYEFTINGTGVEYDDGEDGVVIKDGIKMAVHYKGNLPEYNFLSENPAD